MKNEYTGRQIAIFTDVHGLLEPIVAVLNDIKLRGIKEIYSLGDNIGVGPSPKEVLDILNENNVNIINGNSEDYSALGIEPFKSYFDSKKIASQNWTYSKLSDLQIEKLKTNKHSYDLIVGGKKIGLCHFANDVRIDYIKGHNAWSYQDAIRNKEKDPQKQFYYTNSYEQEREILEKSKIKIPENLGYISALKDRIFDGKKISYYDEIIQGHIHFKMFSQDDNVKVRTLRALAMAYEEDPLDSAFYIIINEKNIGYDITEIYVPYDRQSMLSSIDNSDMPDKERVNKFVGR